VLVDFGGPERTPAVVAAVQRDGTSGCGPTVWQGRPAKRISVSAWNTTGADIDQSLAAVLACAGRG